jgi:hypothetical protein
LSNPVEAEKSPAKEIDVDEQGESEPNPSSSESNLSTFNPNLSNLSTSEPTPSTSEPNPPNQNPSTSDQKPAKSVRSVHNYLYWNKDTEKREMIDYKPDRHIIGIGDKLTFRNVLPP